MTQRQLNSKVPYHSRKNWMILKRRCFQGWILTYNHP